MALLLRARSQLLSGALRRRFLGERGRGARGFSTNPTTGGEVAATGRGATTGGGGGTAANSGGGGLTTGGGPGNGRGAANGLGAASGGGAPANGGGGGGAVTGSGNGSTGIGGCGCAGVAELRTDIYTEVGRVWCGYNKLAEVDEKLLEEMASVQLENAMNQVRSKEELVSTIYKMLGSAAAFTLASATLVGQYVHDSVAHEAAKEVHNLIRLDKAAAEGKVEDTKTAATAAPAAAAPKAKANAEADSAK